jgi:polar amino acid transport system substrate-binding protein
MPGAAFRGRPRSPLGLAAKGSVMHLPVRAILLVSLVLTGAVIASPEQTSALRLVSTQWPPFTSEPGKPRFALDLVEAALGRIGLSATTTIVEAAQFTPAVLGDEFDGSAAAWKDAERERLLVFSQPYLENRLILVARHGDDVSAAALGDLAGKRIAIVEGYSYGDAIEQSGAILVRSRSEEDGLSLLLGKKADYALMDDLVVQFIVNAYPNEAKTRLSLGSKPLLTRPLHLAVRRTRADAESIVSRFNAQLRGMIADRTYHRLLHVPWIRADVDGDGLIEFVPASDRSGSVEPQRAYMLFSNDSEQSKPAESRFYVGGNIYTDWATVPNRYKVESSQWPDSRRSTASIFRFTW